MCSFKVLTYMNTDFEWSLTGAYESFKTKEKSSWVILKVFAVSCGSGRLREPFIKKFEAQFKRGLRKVVVTRTLVTQESGRKESQESFDCNILAMTGFAHQKKLCKLG